MNKHTPGPWYAKDDGYIMSSGTDELGGVVGYFNAKDEDLKLAAAAPDLLEALEGMISLFPAGVEDEGSGIGFTANLKEKYRAAIKAIARAKGESQ